MLKDLSYIIRSKKVIILALFFVFSVTACSINLEKSKEVTDWEDEVLLVQNCGLSGLSCCLDQDEKCESGQECCFDPNNSNINECATECACGEKNTYCCENNSCQDELICSGGRCTECGENNEICCGDDLCSENLLCFENKCVECGKADTPCCKDDVQCEKNVESESRILCIDEVCKNCGRDGKILCPQDPECDSSFFSNNNICMQCGSFNQPCCKIINENDTACNKELKLTCVQGFCSKN